MLKIDDSEIHNLMYPYVKTKSKLIKDFPIPIKWRGKSLAEFLFNHYNPYYELNLMAEVESLHRILKYSQEDIYNMPIMDRAYYIKKHNEAIEEEKNGMSSQSSSSMSQSNVKKMVEQANSVK